MERLRKPFQGVANILRFNWHFYVLAGVVVAGLGFAARLLPEPWALGAGVLGGLAAGTMLVSLGVSHFVYDRSNLYTLDWLPPTLVPVQGRILNVNAGFDETSALLKNRYPTAEMQVFDFYNSETHTEISIRRARKAYPPYPGTQAVKTAALPCPDATVDVVFVLFAAHEIRDDDERSQFFRELHRVCKPTGRVVVTEHLRDGANFLAYTLGFFHFLPGSVWRQTFASADFTVCETVKITPFVTTFLLEKYGVAP